MSIKNWEEITMDSDTFALVRDNFDMLLQKLFQKMQNNHSDEGSINLKIDVKMVEDYIPDEEGNPRKIEKPILKHKITTTVPVKDSFDGKNDTGMELVYDEGLQRYVLKYVSAGRQRSIFDPDFQDIVDCEAEEIEETPKGIAMNNMAIEDKGYASDDYFDSGEDNEERE